MLLEERRRSTLSGVTEGSASVYGRMTMPQAREPAVRSAPNRPGASSTASSVTRTTDSTTVELPMGFFCAIESLPPASNPALEAWTLAENTLRQWRDHGSSLFDSDEEPSPRAVEAALEHARIAVKYAGRDPSGLAAPALLTTTEGHSVVIEYVAGTTRYLTEFDPQGHMLYYTFSATRGLDGPQVLFPGQLLLVSSA